MRRVATRTVHALLVAVLALVPQAGPAAADAGYVIAMSPDHPPFEYDTSDGRLVGVDVDLLASIADDQGFAYSVTRMPFDDGLHAVRDGRVDALMSAVLITDERRAEFDFSDPYFEFGVQMAVPTTTRDIRSYDDLAGKRVAVTTGSDGASFAERISGRYDFTVVETTDADAMYAEARHGNAQAVFDEWSHLNFDIAGGNGFVTVTPKEPGGVAGLVVRKGDDAALLARFNAGLENIRTRGTYDRLVASYLGGSELAVPAAADVSEPGFLADTLGSLVGVLWVPAVAAGVLALVVIARRFSRGQRRASASHPSDSD